jgi:deoxyhypusine synthase
VPHETAQQSMQSSYERIEEEAQSLETISEEVSSKKEYFTYEKLSDNKSIKAKQEEAPVVTTKKDERVPVFSSGDFDLRQGIIYAEILNRKYF